MSYNLDQRFNSNFDKIKNSISSIFGDKKLRRINDPSLINDFGLEISASYLKKLDHINNLRNKYNGHFSIFDGIYSSTNRFLLGWLEAFSFQYISLFQSSTAISKKAISFGLAGFFSGASVILPLSITSQITSQKSQNLLGYFVTSQICLLLASPFAALAHSMFSNGLLTLEKSLTYQFSSFKLLFNSTIGLASILQSQECSSLQAIAYPVVATGAVFHRIWTKNIQFDLVEDKLKNSINDDKIKKVINKLISNTTYKLTLKDFPSIMCLFILGISAPLNLPQLRSREKFKAEWISYIDSDDNLRKPKRKFE